MTNVTMAQFNHTYGLRKFGTCAGAWKADELEGQCLAKLGFQG